MLRGRRLNPTALEAWAGEEDAGAAELAGDGVAAAATAVRAPGATRGMAAMATVREDTAADTTATGAMADTDTTATGATADTITPDTPITVNAASSTSKPAPLACSPTHYLD